MFKIGSGAQTIAPTSALPTITDSAVIDATTQPGYAGSPLIELSGSSAGAGVNGLTVTAGNSTIEGLVIDSFSGDGIDLTGAAAQNDTISGNYIGTNAAGNDPSPARPPGTRPPAMPTTARAATTARWKAA